MSPYFVVLNIFYLTESDWHLIVYMGVYYEYDVITLTLSHRVVTPMF